MQEDMENYSRASLVSKLMRKLIVKLMSFLLLGNRRKKKKRKEKKTNFIERKALILIWCNTEATFQYLIGSLIYL